MSASRTRPPSPGRARLTRSPISRAGRVGPIGPGSIPVPPARAPDRPGHNATGSRPSLDWDWVTGVPSSEHKRRGRDAEHLTPPHQPLVQHLAVSLSEETTWPTLEPHRTAPPQASLGRPRTRDRSPPTRRRFAACCRAGDAGRRSRSAPGLCSLRHRRRRTDQRRL